MAKATNLTNGVFAQIVGDKEYNVFLQSDKDLEIEESDDLKRCKEIYARIVSDNLKDLETLAKLEETITQLRCKEVVKRDFKLSQVRGYIYARTPFFRSGTNIKDIRVVVGKTSDYGEDLNALFFNKDFVESAKEKLMEAMNEQIKLNMIQINKIEEKYQGQYKTN